MAFEGTGKLLNAHRTCTIITTQLQSARRYWCLKWWRCGVAVHVRDVGQSACMSAAASYVIQCECGSRPYTTGFGKEIYLRYPVHQTTQTHGLRVSMQCGHAACANPPDHQSSLTLAAIARPQIITANMAGLQICLLFDADSTFCLCLNMYMYNGGKPAQVFSVPTAAC